MGFSNFFNVLYGILAGVFSALFISRFIEPNFDNFIDFLRNGDGIVSKVYRKCSRLVGLLLYTEKLHPTEGKEYKIFINNGKVSCFRSNIINLRKVRFFKIIQGEMQRRHLSKAKYDSYFKAFIKKENNESYLIWQERFGNKSKKTHINSKYKLVNNNEKMYTGIAIEFYNNEVVQSMCMLSFSKIGYAGLKDLAFKNIHIHHYLETMCIDINKIDRESDRFITYEKK